MNEENNTQNNNIQNSGIPDPSKDPTSMPDLLTDDFFSQIKNSKKINDKKKKIDELTKSLKENPSYLNSSKNQQKISQLYNLLISNLNENNNNYVSSQIKLIETLINNNKSNEKESYQNFKNFSKQALPKLFDKYYLQNQKINDNLTDILGKFIDNKILNIQDYYPHIENISLEEDDNYRNNIMNLLNEQFEKNKEITKDNIPKGILDIVNRLSNDDDDNVSDVAKKSLDILNNRKPEILTKVKEEKENDNKKDNINVEENNNKKLPQSEIKENTNKDEDNSINKVDKEN